MMSVKDSWKRVGSDLNDIGEDIASSDLGKDVVKLGSDLGKSIIKSVKAGIKAIADWADSIDEPKAKEAAEHACDAVKECAEEFCEQTEVIFAEAAEAVEHAAEAAEEKAEDACCSVEEAVCEAVETAEEKAECACCCTDEPKDN